MCVLASVALSQLTVTSLPAVIFEPNGGTHKVVEGSVIQLYCSVESTTATISWTKDGNSVMIDICHVRERTCSDSTSTTSVLTIEGFQSSDNGTYQCVAVDGTVSGVGNSVTLIGTLHAVADIFYSDFSAIIMVSHQ